MFIRKTIEEIERSSNRFKDEKEATNDFVKVDEEIDIQIPSTSKALYRRNSKQGEIRDGKKDKEDEHELKDDNKRKDVEKGNGKKKSKSRARLEREQSKPSESDTEQDVDTVTVEIPRRRKRPRRASERPRTPPASLHSDSEGEVSISASCNSCGNINIINTENVKCTLFSGLRFEIESTRAKKRVSGSNSQNNKKNIFSCSSKRGIYS